MTTRTKAPATKRAKQPTAKTAAKAGAREVVKAIASAIEKPTAKKPTAKKTAKKPTAKKTAKATTAKPTAKKTAKATTKATAKQATAKASANTTAAKKPTAKQPTAKKTTKTTAAKAVVPKTSQLKGTPIAEFVLDRLSGWQAEAVEALCALVLSEAPQATQAIKWSQPVFELGGPFAFIRLAAKHVTFGFWRGADLKDPRGVLEGTSDRMKHIKLRSATLDEPLLRGFIRQAIKLNATSGNPTKR